MDRPIRPGESVPSTLTVGQKRWTAFAVLPILPVIYLLSLPYLLSRTDVPAWAPLLYLASVVINVRLGYRVLRPRRFEVDFEKGTYREESGWFRGKIVDGCLGELDFVALVPAVQGRDIVFYRDGWKSPPVAEIGKSLEEQHRMLESLGRAAGLPPRRWLRISSDLLGRWTIESDSA